VLKQEKVELVYRNQNGAEFFSSARRKGKEERKAVL
jgi:hypothetical protein